MALSRASALATFFCLALFSAVSEARFIIVGNSSDSIEPWTQIGVNYTQWAIDNPFYIGDVAVFKYRKSYHVVWQLPDVNAWDNCAYDNALFIGNASAGVGPGFFVTVTADPIYLACGIFGHCEVGQKVVIQGTMGPLPATLNGLDVPPPPPFTPPTVAASPPPFFSIAQSPPASSQAAVAPPPPAATAATAATANPSAPTMGGGTPATASSSPTTKAPSTYSAASAVGPAATSLVMIASAIVLLL